MSPNYSIDSLLFTLSLIAPETSPTKSPKPPHHRRPPSLATSTSDVFIFFLLSFFFLLFFYFSHIPTENSNFPLFFIGISIFTVGIWSSLPKNLEIWNINYILHRITPPQVLHHLFIFNFVCRMYILYMYVNNVCIYVFLKCIIYV